MNPCLNGSNFAEFSIYQIIVEKCKDKDSSLGSSVHLIIHIYYIKLYESAIMKTFLCHNLRYPQLGQFYLISKFIKGVDD